MGKKKQDERPEWTQTLGLFGVIVGEMVGLSLAGFALGYWLTEVKGAPQWVWMICALAGLTLAIYRIYWITVGRKQKEDDSSQ